MKELLRASGITQEALSRRLGKNHSTIANRLRLLKLPMDVRKVILEGNLTERHARALLKIEDDPEAQYALAEKAVDKGLTVKKLEALVEREKEKMILRKKKLKTILRDKQMFINAVRDTVKRFTEAEAGKKYHYWLYEYNTERENIDYDKTVHEITIELDINENNELCAELSVNGKAAQEIAVSFENRYFIPITPPDTGDEAKPILWAGMLMASAVGMIVLKKKRYA